MPYFTDVQSGEQDGQAKAPKVGRVTLPGIVTAWIALGPAKTLAATEPGQLTHALRPASECQSCHLFSNPEEHQDGANISPWAWRGSMMAQAAVDPIFWAGVAIAAQDQQAGHPGSTEDCIRCHAPRAFLAQRHQITSIEELAAEDRMGIDCDFCHRLTQQEDSLGNARYAIDDEADSGGVVVRGPWGYDGREAEESPEHPWSGPDVFLSSSEFCGTCHDVSTHRERVDASGNNVGHLFNEQRTYSEWKNSDYSDSNNQDSATCQKCHMPAIANAAGCKDFSSIGLNHDAGARRHDLSGANWPMLALLRQTLGSSGSGELDDAFFDLSIEQSHALLQQAATLELHVPESTDVDEEITGISIRVENQSGHKLPTGYSEGRIMWIEVRILWDEQLLFHSGAWDEQRQEWLGDPESDLQFRSYQALAEDADDGTQLHLLRNNRWIEDSRIPPKGLQPDPQTDPVGDRYKLQPGGTWPHWDETSYQFPALNTLEFNEAIPEKITVQARLLYLINTPEYLDFLLTENHHNSAGDDVAELFEEHRGHQLIVLAEATQEIPVFSGNDENTGGVAEETTESASGTRGAGSTGSTGSSESATEGGPPNNSAGCQCQSGPKSIPIWLVGPLIGLATLRRRKYQ